MNKDKLIDNLKKICLNTTPLTPDFFKEHKYSKMWMRKGITVFLSKEDTVYYYNLLKEIITEKNIAQSFTIADIEKLVREIISEVLKLNTKDDMENKIISEVDNFLQNLQKQIEEWEFIIPIENMDILTCRFTISEVELFKFSKYQYFKQLKEYKQILNSNIHYKDNTDFKKSAVKQFRKHNLDPLLNHTCARIKVKGTHEGAKQLAIKKVDFELSLIKLFGYYNDSSNRMYFGIKGEIIPYNTRIIIGKKTDKKSVHPTWETTGYLFEFTLDKKRRDFMKKNGFNTIRKLLAKTNKTDLDLRILNSIYWYSKAYDIPEIKKVDDKKTTTNKCEEVEYFYLGDKYLKLMIALECLLIFGRENKSFNIKTRSSYILTDNKQQRKQLQKYAQEAYETRSKIVHEGGYIVSKSETNSLMNYVQSVIIALIKFKKKWKLHNNEDFYQWCEKNRLKDRL